MPRDGHDFPDHRPRRGLRRRPALRGALALVGSLAALATLGPGVVMATSTGATSPAGVTAPTDVQDPGMLTTPAATAPAQSPSTSSAPPVEAPTPDGPLVVTMSATPQVATVGQTVTYTADVSGEPAGKQVLYHWAFDGGTGVGQQISRSYPNPGDYPVAVTVTVASVAGLSGVADTLTVVVSNAQPAKLPGSAGTAGGGSGSGTGKGNGTGSGPAKSAAAAKKRSAKTTTAQGVASPLATQAPNVPGMQQVEGFLLSDQGAPFTPPSATAPTSSSSGSGGSAGGASGAGGVAGVGGAIALTIAIVTLGALDERRRISLRTA